SSALDLVNAKFVREIQPGEVIFIGKDGIESIYPFTNPGRKAYCIFEDIYFARPDSFIFGENVHEARKKLGRALAREHPVEPDLVIAIPDTGNSAAIGYAQESGLPFDLGITRNHYIGRTFLQPRQAIRDFGVKVKLNPVRETIAGKRLIVVEDSIVRGTTSVKRMAILREAGASEIHLRISCPPHRYPCYYGIDFPTRAELIAASKSVQEIAGHLDVDSLGYLSLEGMLGCMKEAAEDFCTACFDGKYPVPIDGRRDKFIARSDRQQEKLNFP
ncbi:MAG: amidophosphoribosyltransferase, partial [Thermoplasmata archaeon]|nr:amidophosphoribosyltransferase [Thermoplasmata archaeon]